MSGRRSSYAAAASRLGITAADYAARRDAGQRWCVGCREWHPESEFSPDAVRGVNRLCRKARRERRKA